MTAPDVWTLPQAVAVEGEEYAIHSDYRDILGIIAWLTGAEGADLDPGQRWYVALRLFYPRFAAMPRSRWGPAAEALAAFIAGGRPGGRGDGARLLDWRQDAPLIVSGVNRVAGQDVRALPYLHWWSFLASFDAIGEGALCTVVAIRDKLRRGKKLEPWELDFYRSHRAQVDLRPLPAGPADAAADRAEHDRLLALLA